MTSELRPQRVVGRYAVYDEIASGGMATVHIGRLMASAGFSRAVAIKRLHANLARDPEFTSMFLDEARLAARIRHPNVIQTIDVVARDGELFLVMEYVVGEALSVFMRQARRVRGRVPVPIATHIVCEALHGLHAAHEAKNERGEPLGIVHRDISPQNVMVGADGITRVFDFGIAKSLGRVQSTREGQLKGKLGYMAPEQFMAEPVTRRSDVFAAGIVLWEAITGQRLFGGANEAEVVYAALGAEVKPPSTLAPDIPPALDAVVARALDRDPAKRYETAEEMAVALETACPQVTKRAVMEWVQTVAPPTLLERRRKLEAIESLPADAWPEPLPEEDAIRSAATMRPTSPLSDPASLTAVLSEAGSVPVHDDIPGLRSRWSRRRVLLAGAALACVVGLSAALFAPAPAGPPEAAAPSSSAQAPASANEPAPVPMPSAESASTVETPPATAPAASASAAPTAAVRAASTPPRPTGTGAARKRVRDLLGRD